MKLTFIAEDGVEVEPKSLGELDYTDWNDFIVAARAQHDELWGADGSTAGYEELIAKNYTTIDNYFFSGEWVATLFVPYGYLLLTR
jgi:hypothetical protein